MHSKNFDTCTVQPFQWLTTISLSLLKIHNKKKCTQIKKKFQLYVTMFKFLSKNMYIAQIQL